MTWPVCIAVTRMKELHVLLSLNLTSMSGGTTQDQDTMVKSYKLILCPKCRSRHKATMVIAVRTHCNPLDKLIIDN